MFFYRKLIARLFTLYAFEEYATTELDICMDLANILLMRIGSRVARWTAGQLITWLLSDLIL